MKRSKAFQSVSRSRFAGRSNRLVTLAVSGSSPAMTQESAPPGPPTSTSSSQVDGGRAHAGAVDRALAAPASSEASSGDDGVRAAVRREEGEKRCISASQPAEPAAAAEVAEVAAAAEAAEAAAATEARRLCLASPPPAGSASSAGATEGSAE